MDYNTFKKYVHQKKVYKPFRKIFDEHESLLRFVYHEKSLCQPISEDRRVLDPITHAWVTGHRCASDRLKNKYAPDHIKPFALKGIWLPLNQGKLFSTSNKVDDCPLVRDIDGEKRILFIIHPTSKKHYRHVLKQHSKHVIQLYALALSSTRTLLVSIPDSTQGYISVMVKVSLSLKGKASSRLLTERECALSVANSSLLKKKIHRMAKDDRGHAPLYLFEETLSYVPEGSAYGFIYRPLPEFLTSPKDDYVMPLLALYGYKNLPFFKFLVEKNDPHACVTEFLKKNILNPFAMLLTELLCTHQTSIEAHGQNLMLLLTHDHLIQGLVYRDMGGVNQWIDPTDEALPLNLRVRGLDYFSTHRYDAAHALEHGFINRGLFPLTKQLVNAADDFSKHDPKFSAWYHTIVKSPHHYIHNWLTPHASDQHKTTLMMNEYYRYGYVETLFGLCLIDYLHDKKIIDDTVCNITRNILIHDEEQEDGSMLAPSSVAPLFLMIVDLMIQARPHPRTSIVQDS